MICKNSPVITVLLQTVFQPTGFRPRIMHKHALSGILCDKTNYGVEKYTQ